MKIWDSSFELGDAVSEEQLAFFKEHGVIVFRNFLQKEQVATYIAEQQRSEAQWIAEKKEKVKVYVKNPKTGRVVKVDFGEPGQLIKKSKKHRKHGKKRWNLKK